MSETDNQTPPNLDNEALIEDLEPIEPPSAPPIPPTSLPTSSLTQEDLDFIELVFAQVEHVDFKTPAATSKGRLTGIDKKLHDLREQVRRLERELARVGHIWSNKQKELNQAASTLQSKDTEVRKAQQDARALAQDVATKIEDIRNLEGKTSELVQEVDAGKEARLEQIERLSMVETASTKALTTKEGELIRSRNAYDALKELSHDHRATSREQLLSSRMQNEDLRDRLAAMELQATTRMRDSIAQSALRSELQQQVLRLVEERHAQEDEIAELTSTASKSEEGSQATRIQLEKQNSELNSQLIKQAERIADLEAQSEASQTRAREAQSQLVDQKQTLQAALSEARTELERSESMAQAHKSALSRLREEFDQKQNEQNDTTTKLRAEAALLTSERKELEEELRRHQDSHSEEVVTREQSGGLIGSLQDRIKALEERLDSSTSELREKLDSVAKLEHRHQELTEKLRLAERDKTTLAQRVGQLEAT